MAEYEFEERLASSERKEDEPFWEAVYRAAFPDFVALHTNFGNNAPQRCGVDQLIVLHGGKTLIVQQKTRHDDYGDMLFEFISQSYANGRTVPGWIERADQTVDYLAYGIPKTRRCFLFPWQSLRRAWLDHGKAWRAMAQSGERGYRIVKATTRPSTGEKYDTFSVVVPMQVALGAITGAFYAEPRPAVLTDAQKETLGVLSRHPEWTAAELASCLRRDLSEDLAELRRLGLARVVGRTQCRMMKRDEDAWRCV